MTGICIWIGEQCLSLEDWDWGLSLKSRYDDFIINLYFWLKMTSIINDQFSYSFIKLLGQLWGCCKIVHDFFDRPMDRQTYLQKLLFRSLKIFTDPNTISHGVYSTKFQYLAVWASVFQAYNYLVLKSKIVSLTSQTLRY